MTARNLPHVSALALEAWRASGERTLARLRKLVTLYANTRHDMTADEIAHCTAAAVGAARSWEIEGE